MDLARRVDRPVFDNRILRRTATGASQSGLSGLSGLFFESGLVLR